MLRETNAVSDKTSIPIGVILGLVLGLVLVVAWERSDPRIDGAGELANAAGAPATALGDVAPGNIDALLERWRRLAGDGAGPHVVALLAGTRRAEGARASGGEPSWRASARPTASCCAWRRAPPAAAGGERGLVVVTGGLPGGPAAGEAVAADAAVVVVAVQRGARAMRAARDARGARPVRHAPDVGAAGAPLDRVEIEAGPRPRRELRLERRGAVRLTAAAGAASRA